MLVTANIIQTIPSLALFGFLLPVPWIGERAGRLAILALTLYALLPVIRNTFTGVKGVDRAVTEAARGMGLTDWQMLYKVEVPLAASVILAGVRVAVVTSVGLATIAAAVHFLDVGGAPAPEAKGLEAMLKGAREKARGDDALLAEAMRILDLLYSGLTGSRS